LTDMTYLDNAATSYPKPDTVYEAMDEFYRRHGVNPGRTGADAAVEAGNVIEATRAELSAFFNNPARDPRRLVFTSNATDSLNTCIQGICRPGDHVVSTHLEHNSVLRPLHEMARLGLITFDLAPFDAQGFVDPQAVVDLVRPETRLVAMNHGSNVLGTVQDIAAVGAACRERGVTFLADAAQTAGYVPIDMEAMSIDLLAFTGHKSLLGPVGIGGVAVGPDVDLRSTRWGGTGVRSRQLTHLEEYPYRLEAGTLNTLGIAGLRAGLAWVRERGLDDIAAHERSLTKRLCEGFAALPGLKLHCAGADVRHTPVVSVTLDGMSPEETGQRLDVDHGVIVRMGLQCAPLAHAGIGTHELGTTRFSLGPLNEAADVDRAVAAMNELARAAVTR